MKCYQAKPSDVVRSWVEIDAAGKTLGRLAVDITRILRGRNKPTWTPHVDTGDFVVVTNAAKVVLTGRKEERKTYHRYSGFRSGLKVLTVSDIRAKHPDWLISLAVKGMMPKNVQSREAMKRLKIYAGAEHPHSAQKPQKIMVA